MGADVLVTAAGGTVGREVVRELRARGARIRVFVRNEARVAHLPAEVERAVGDLGDRDALGRALEGVRAVFWLAPHEPDRERLAHTIVTLCEQQRIRLVYTGDHIDIAIRPLRRAIQWYYGRKYPHYAASFRIGERIHASRVETVVLVPTTYAQNDELFREEILRGEYPLPYRCVTPVDVRDVAAAAARALVDASVVPGVYALTGPAALTGPQCAAAWTETLGREVRWTGGDVDAFARLLESRLTGEKLSDFRKSFRLLSEIAMPAPTAKQLAQTQVLLGRAPRSYAEYVKDAAARWRVAAGG